jgi:hypothetical protein
MANNDLKALRYNSGKAKWGLISFPAIEPLVRVLEFGATKYAPDNWKLGFKQKELLECLQRHLIALFEGEELDKESGLPHIGHVMCNAMFYSYEKLVEEGKVERPKIKDSL